MSVNESLKNWLAAKNRLAAMTVFFLIAVAFASCGDNRRGPVSWDADAGYCPVCQMKVKAADQSAAEIRYRDKTKILFESAGDLLTFYFAPERYNTVTDFQKTRSNIDAALLKDYNTKQQVDASRATLVYKSRLEGPMGPDVFAFGKPEDATQFASANGGEVVTFDALTPAMVKNLRKR